jgi:hypothetical protein
MDFDIVLDDLIQTTIQVRTQLQEPGGVLAILKQASSYFLHCHL